MNEHQQSGDLLGSQRADKVVTVAKSVLGTLPWVGPAVSELVQHIIPNQRVDRIVAMLRELERRLNEQEIQQLSDWIDDPEAVDLLEDGFIQAARALSEDRIKYIASILANGITDDKRGYMQTKRLLQILGELNDAEIIILRAYSYDSRQDEEFHEKHHATICGPGAHMESSEEEIDRGAVHNSYRDHLARLGLLRPNFKKPRRGELPEFDPKTGMMKANSYELTRLGGILLVILDLAKNPY